MELPVYTSLLRLERRLYQVGQVELPRPVSLLEAGAFVAALGLLVLLARLLRLGFSANWAWAFVVLPWLAAWAASQPLADRRRAHSWALSQLRHLLAEPRLLARLEPAREPARLRLAARVWQPGPARRRARRSGGAGGLEALGRLRLEVTVVDGQARAPSGGRGWSAG